MKVKQRSVCQTCRTRKLGCDGKRPECSQCVLTGRKCDGYQPDWTFVPQNNHSAKLSSISKQQRGQITVASRGKSQATPLAFGSPGAQSLAYVDLQGMLRPRSSVPQSILGPRWDDILGLVIQSYIPEGEMASITDFSDSKRPRICGSWMEVLPIIIGTSDRDCVLHASIKALATSILSRNLQMGGSTLDSVQNYDTAVHVLRKGFTVTGYAFHAAFIAAVMCLALVEIMLPDSREAFMAHVKGVEHLLQTQDLNQYRSGVLHSLFVGFRPVLMIQAFRCRQPTFLASEPWIRIPFSTSEPSPMQSILSEAAVIPSLLQQIDTLLCNPCQASPSEVTKILGSFVDVLNHLENWEWCLHQKNTTMHYWPVVTDTQFTGPSGHNKSLWFSSVTMANVYTHVWAFRITCLIEIDKLMSLFPSFICEYPPLLNQFDFDHIQEHMMVLSEQICLSTEYLMQDEMKLFGPASMFYPLQIAYQTLKMDEPGQKGNLARIEGVVGRLVEKGLQSASSIVFSGNVSQYAPLFLRQPVESME